jgi:hypothetical protein
MKNYRKENLKNKKLVAWGASPLFSLYLQNCPENNIAYCVDLAKEKQGKTIQSIPIVPPEQLKAEKKGSFFVINFGHSSSALQSINITLSDHGLRMGRDYIDFAEYARSGFKKKAERIFQTKFSAGNFAYARAFNLNSVIPLETTVLGNWLLLEALRKTARLGGAVAEIGAYKGGNSYLLSTAMSLWDDARRYYVIDSFEGFSKMSKSDPAYLQNAYNYDYQVDRIFNLLSVFKHMKVIKGFVSKAFREISAKEKFSVVFFDCDLYQPALDTYHYFWDKLQKGGILVIHDNVATIDGWTGVRKATEEYFIPRGIKFSDLWETTMSVIIK